jgi:hypothetical protein
MVRKIINNDKPAEKNKNKVLEKPVVTEIIFAKLTKEKESLNDATY